MVDADSLPARVSAEQLCSGLVRALVAPEGDHSPAGFLVGADDISATVVLATTGEPLTLLPWHEHSIASRERMRERVAQVRAHARAPFLHIVLVGGGDEAWRLCLDESAIEGPQRFALHSVDASGEVHNAGRRLKALEPAAQQVAEHLARGEPIPYFSSAEMAAARVRFEQAARAESDTRTQIGQRNSPATTGLIIAVLSIYAVQWYFGDVLKHGTGDHAETFLLQMGALWMPAMEQGGQWWRLLSCTFLHGSLMHVATNAWSLWALGRFVERVLGTPRYIVLYTVSGIASSIASAMLGHLSVGASGAIFGILGGLMALTYVRRVLPATIGERLRRSMWPVLLLNLGISLMPGIDWSAHLGGAAAGAALAGSGLLTAGLPGVTAPMEGVVRSRRNRVWIAAAAACVLLMAACVGAALVTGRPWESPDIGG